MANNRDAMSDLKRILAEREVLYSKGDIQVDTAGRTFEESLEMLIQALRDTPGSRITDAGGHLPLSSGLPIPCRYRVDGHWLEAARIEARDPNLPTIVMLHEGLGSVAHWKDFPARSRRGNRRRRISLLAIWTRRLRCACKSPGPFPTCITRRKSCFRRFFGRQGSNGLCFSDTATAHRSPFSMPARSQNLPPDLFWKRPMSSSKT